MMRLVKLLALGLVGYAVYEFFRGMTEGSSPSQSPASRADEQRNEIGRRPTRSAPTGQVLSSTPMPTGGMEVTTGDPIGQSVTHRVGRGVIRPAQMSQ